jgi:hypothetical protein
MVKCPKEACSETEARETQHPHSDTKEEEEIVMSWLIILRKTTTNNIMSNHGCQEKWQNENAEKCFIVPTVFFSFHTIPRSTIVTFYLFVCLFILFFVYVGWIIIIISTELASNFRSVAIQSHLAVGLERLIAVSRPTTKKVQHSIIIIN